MKVKQGEATKNRVIWKSWLAKALLLPVLIVVVAVAIFAAIVSFDKFLQVAVTALVMLTGICWAVRTTNVHQYKVAERNMETYIWLYEYAGSEIKEGYRRVIENYNAASKALLDHGKLFSYMTLYLLFSAFSLFTAEMLVLIFNGFLRDLCPSQCLCVWWAAVGLAILSGLLFVFACVSFGMYFGIIGKCRCTERFKKCSASLARKTYILEENYWPQFYRTNREPQPGYEEALRKVIQEDNWLRGLPGINIDC